MNIINTEIPFVVEAKTTGCHEKKEQKYHVSFYRICPYTCLDKEELLNSQIRSCERLLKRPEKEQDMDMVQNELKKLKLALEAVQN
jgi:hypothetical protein